MSDRADAGPNVMGCPVVFVELPANTYFVMVSQRWDGKLERVTAYRTGDITTSEPVYPVQLSGVRLRIPGD